MPAASLADDPAFLRAFGISRVADQTGLDVLGVPVWAAIRPGARSLCITTGKGLTHAHARLTAIMEAVETACAEDSERLVARRGSIRALERADVPFLPLDRLQKRRAQPDLDRERAWLRGEWLDGGGEAWAPYEAVGLDDRPEAPWDREAFAMSSVGLAAHPDRDAALEAALLEAAEHDGLAQALAWPGSLAALPRLDPATAASTDLDELAARAGGAGLEPVFLDATTDVGLPVALCVLRELDNVRPRVSPFAGSACRPFMANAMVAALLEAIQSRATDIAGARDDIRAEDYRRRDGPAPRIDGRMRAVPAEGPALGVGSAGLLAQFRDRGFWPAAAFDLAPPGLGVACVAVAVAGLEIGAAAGALSLGPRARRRVLRLAARRAAPC